MNNLKMYFDRFVTGLMTVLSKIEESALFEKLVLKFEALEPRQQRGWRIGGILAGAIVIGSIVLLPVYLVLRQKMELSNTRDLVNELHSFNNENSVVKRPAPRPQGWQAMPGTNLKEMESTLEQYSETLGIPPDFISLKSNPPGEINIAIKELSLRQAVAIIFQIDGWHAGLDFDSLKVSVNRQSKDLLTLDAKLRYDQQLIASISQLSVSPSAGGARSPNPVNDGSNETGVPQDFDSPSASPSLRPGVPGRPGTGNFPDDEFMTNENPPPPLNFEDDL